MYTRTYKNNLMYYSGTVISEIIYGIISTYECIACAAPRVTWNWYITDVRHQDAALYQVRNAILNQREKEEEEDDKENIGVLFSVPEKGKRTLGKTTTTKQIIEKVNNEIKLPGDWILAGKGLRTVVYGSWPPAAILYL